MIHSTYEVTLAERNTEYSLPVSGTIRRYKISIYPSPSSALVSTYPGDVSQGKGQPFSDLSPFDSGYTDLESPTFYFASEMSGVRILLEVLALTAADSGLAGLLYQDGYPCWAANDLSVGVTSWDQMYDYASVGAQPPYYIQDNGSTYLLRLTGITINPTGGTPSHLTIPATATIVGVETFVYGWDGASQAISVSGNLDQEQLNTIPIYDNVVRLVIDDVPIGDNKANNKLWLPFDPSADIPLPPIKSWGSPTDDWNAGATLTPTNTNEDWFGFCVSVKSIKVFPTESAYKLALIAGQLPVGEISRRPRIRVWYTP